jgi:ACS family hexuronate transporter-like MFS transporter
MAKTGSSTVSVPPYAQLRQRPTNFRWVVCGLLFYATTINYVDRAVLGVLGPTLQKNMHWSDVEFGKVNAAWTAAYALGFIFMGPLIDKIGTRLGYAIALGFWSLAGGCHALARSALQFGICRFMLGFWETGNFPAAIKTVAEWFPQRQRATATGVFNAGSNVGAVLAPLAIPPIVMLWGWPAAFLITPILALIWIVMWLTMFRSPAVHPRVNQAERDLILSDSPPASTATARWRVLLPHRQTWAIVVGKTLTDPIWWFYLFWSGKFFSDRFHVKLAGLAAPLILIFVMADVGSLLGGWFSSALIKRGWTPNAARKTAMLTCALCVAPVSLAPVVSNMWVAAALISLAASAHQGFSANIFTCTSDMFQKSAVGSVVGLAGFCAGTAGILMNYGSGAIKQATGSYLIMFIIAASVYVLAVVCVHLLAPRLTPVDLTEPRPFPVMARIFLVLAVVASVFGHFSLLGLVVSAVGLFAAIVSFTKNRRSTDLAAGVYLALCIVLTAISTFKALSAHVPVPAIVVVVLLRGGLSALLTGAALLCI